MNSCSDLVTSTNLRSEDRALNQLEDWEFKCFDEFGTLFSGSTPKTGISAYWDGSVTWVTPNDLSRLRSPYLFETAKTLTEKGLKSCSAQLLPSRSIVMSSRAPIGYVAIPETDFCTNQGCKSIKLKKGYDPEFAYYSILHNIDAIKNLGEGTTFAEISKTALASIALPFPRSKPEQTKIAEILSTVDRAIEQTEALIAKQQRIKTGLMQDLLTRGIDEHGNLRSEETHEFKDSPLGRIPVEWEVPTIEELLTRKVLAGVQDGNHGEKHPKSRDLVSEGIPFIMATDISGGFVDTESANKITESQYLGLRIGFARPGDVLLSHKASIGFVALVPNWLTKLMLTPQVTYYRVGDSLTLLPEYLAQFFRSELYQERLKGMAKQSTRDYIGILAQRKLRIAFPKQIAEQKEIAKTLSAADKRVTALRKALGKLRFTKAALMQDLLTGERRVNPLLDSEAGTVETP
jgi:type I restriction enzyme S subunit